MSDATSTPELLLAAQELDRVLEEQPTRSGFDPYAMRMPTAVSLAIRRVREAARAALSAAQDAPAGLPLYEDALRDPMRALEAEAAHRYQAVASDQSMFHRHAVVAGDGKQQLYRGREVECQNMAAKFTGAFLDGAFAYREALRAARASQPTPAQDAAATVPWNPMATAPTDGTPVLLLIDDNEHPLYDETMSVSIGSYGVDGGPKEDPAWHFAGWSWHHDCYCRGEGKPIGWLPIPGTGAVTPVHPMPADVVDWAVGRWKEQVQDRPIQNVHRRTLDGVWRQVIRFAGGDPESLIGPRHDDLAAPPAPQAAPTAAQPVGDKYDDVLMPFLSLMRRELHANSGKGDRPGWLQMSASTALLEVYHHLAKLQKAVKNNDGPGIQEYSADVANMAMMVLDVCGGLALVDTAPSPQAPALVPLTDHHKLDNDQQVFFYEQDFYVLSNFSAFNLKFNGLTFPTSEHAYHYEKFAYERVGESVNDAFQRRNLAMSIKEAPSAHWAFKLAERWKGYRRADWDAVKVDIMREILRAKASQHEYVRRKLLETGDRELIEDSWRDDYWGWGPNRDGQNMLGKLWMEVRAGLRGITPAGTTPKEQQ